MPPLRSRNRPRIGRDDRDVRPCSLGTIAVLPSFSGQPRYVAKMLIPRGQGQSVLLCDGGNPDIVFWYGAAL